MKIYTQINKYKFLFGILFLSMCFQNIEILNFGLFGLKLFHVIGFLFFPFLLKKYKKIKIPCKPMLFFLIYMLFISLINVTNYGINSLNFNYVFSFYILLLIYNCGEVLSKKDWLDIIKNVAIVTLISVYINVIIHYEAILKFFKNPYGHPLYNYIFGGGANLEATWIGFFGLFFKDSKKGYIYIIFGTLLSVLLASRVGILINAFCFVIITLASFDDKKWLVKKDRVLLMIILTILLIVFFVQTGLIDYLLTRIQSIGKDPGSKGRLNMWENVATGIENNPFGVGLGNATKSLNRFSKEYIWEDNVHNIYFQMFLDTGVIGGIVFLFFVIYFLYKNWKYIFYDSIIAFIFAYLLFGLLQFRGGETIIYYIIGIYFINKNRNKIIKKEEDK